MPSAPAFAEPKIDPLLSVIIAGVPRTVRVENRGSKGLSVHKDLCGEYDIVFTKSRVKPYWKKREGKTQAVIKYCDDVCDSDVLDLSEDDGYFALIDAKHGLEFRSASLDYMNCPVPIGE
jgi:hypothetical protein